MKQTELIKFITEISENGVSFSHGKGFEFFRDTLLPNIENAEKIAKKELLADCWYIIGDIYDFNDAPLKAIESYRKAIEFDPNFSSAYREIGNMQERIGDYSNAIKNIEKAILLEPTDENLITELKEVKKSLQINEKPLYRKDSLNWKLSELLANKKFDEVIELTKNSIDINELKRKANAYACLGDNEKYLKLWKIIEQSKTEIEIEYSDWFYMPDQVYESDQIWIIFKQMNSRIKSSIFIQSESLYANYKELSDINRRELMCDYQIYDNTENKDGINQMRLKYPNWEELKTNANTV
ncbi:hypothetical protein SHK09_15180 [Polaribacter sp. PL03]|uniref:tetratricopeptide repeat protein n=1 Tax=Polaribacter sp. PL03 TaxID=3088353 RepID=UPI0029CCCF91|nr:hypothetical protein [Polaribacter sp. PL03]MDX6748139.1 hypothetical protein [Polaribacter sp. PL03]